MTTSWGCTVAWNPPAKVPIEVLAQRSRSSHLPPRPPGNRSTTQSKSATVGNWPRLKPTAATEPEARRFVQICSARLRER
jgi:hypothetical protein